MLYRGYEQAVILVGIVDLNVNCDYIGVMSRQ